MYRNKTCGSNACGTCILRPSVKLNSASLLLNRNLSHTGLEKNLPAFQANLDLATARPSE
jgi:hypothetical protein